MNRGLLVVSVLLIVAGIASGFIPLIVLGIFLLLPALVTGRRVRRSSKKEPTTTTTVSTTTSPSYRSQEPSQRYTEAISPSSPPQQTTMTASTGSGTLLLLPPVFPTQIFPTLSPLQSVVFAEPRKGEQPSPHQDEIPVELLEMGAVFLLGRFLARRKRHQPT